LPVYGRQRELDRLLFPGRGYRAVARRQQREQREAVAALDDVRREAPGFARELEDLVDRSGQIDRYRSGFNRPLEEVARKTGELKRQRRAER
jgi:hypothetical protein